MIKEAIQFVKDQTAAALGVERLVLPGQPVDRPYLRVGQDFKKVELDPAPRNIRLDGLDSLSEVAFKHFDTRIATNNRMAVFVDENAIELIFDTNDGRERAILPLHASPEWSFMHTQIQNSGVINQEELRKALRYIINECWSPEVQRNMVELVSSIKWRTEAMTTSTIDRRATSQGIHVNSETSMAGQIDEVQVLQLRRWRNRDIKPGKFPMQWLFDPDHEKQRFIFFPFPASLDEYKAESISALRDQVESVLTPRNDDGTSNGKPTCPVYRGRFPDRKVDVEAITKN